MTIAEAKNFYNQDEKKYILCNNKELLLWLKQATMNGYHLNVSIEILQNLIDNIVFWYEMKYPEREMEFYEGVVSIDFEGIESLSRFMDIKQLLYRLPHKQLCLIECEYRSIGGGLCEVYDEVEKKLRLKSKIFMRIIKKDDKYNTLFMPSFLLTADSTTGIVDLNSDLKDYIDIDNLKLDELLRLFSEKYDDVLEYSYLKECVFDHNCDVELRRQVLQLVALKLLYSDRTTPERGYKRAILFINEFNDALNLGLSKDEINELIKKDYKKQNVSKRKRNKKFFSIN